MAVALALAVANEQLPRFEVDVLDPQPRAFQDPKARAVHELGHEEWRTAHAVDDAVDLTAGEHHRKTRDAAWALEILDPRRIGPQDPTVEETDRAECLDVGGCADATFPRQAVEECPDVLGVELTRVAPLVHHEPADPSKIRLSGSRAQVVCREGLLDPVAKRGFLLHGRR